MQRANFPARGKRDGFGKSYFNFAGGIVDETRDRFLLQASDSGLRGISL
jgi:hypothetical protein